MAKQCSYIYQRPGGDVAVGEQCLRPARNKGRCQMHYLRESRGQDMDAPAKRKPTPDMRRAIAGRKGGMARRRPRAERSPDAVFTTGRHVFVGPDDTCDNCGGRILDPVHVSPTPPAMGLVKSTPPPSLSFDFTPEEVARLGAPFGVEPSGLVVRIVRTYLESL